MEYKIEISDSYALLEKNVQRMIASGWRPCGGVSSSDGRAGFLCAQALTRESEFQLKTKAC